MKLFFKIFIGLSILLIGIYFSNFVRKKWLFICIILSSYLISSLTINDFKIKLNFHERITSKKNHNFSFYVYLIISIICIFLLNTCIPYLLNFLIYNKEILFQQLQVLSVIDLIFMILIFPIFEEILFRKIIAHKLLIHFGLWRAIFFSATFFSIMHIFSDTGLINAFIAGVILAVIFLKTKEIKFSILVHILSNLLIYWFSISDFNLKNSSEIVIFGFTIGVFLLLTIFYRFKKIF